MLGLVERKAVRREDPLDVVGDGPGARDRGNHGVVSAAAEGLEVLDEDGGGCGEADGVKDGVIGAVLGEVCDDSGGGLLVVDDGGCAERGDEVLVARGGSRDDLVAGGCGVLHGEATAGGRAAVDEDLLVLGGGGAGDWGALKAEVDGEGRGDGSEVDDGGGGAVEGNRGGDLGGGVHGREGELLVAAEARVCEGLAGADGSDVVALLEASHAVADGFDGARVGGAEDVGVGNGVSAKSKVLLVAHPATAVASGRLTSGSWPQWG